MKKELILTKSAVLWSNEYYLMEDCILLKVFRMDGTESYDVFIDTGDFDLVSKGQWFATIQQEKEHHKEAINIVWTSKLNGKKVNYIIYQLIMNSKDKGIVIDHIDMDRLNNRKSNLRIASCRVNSINQIHKGYNLDKQTGRYLVRVSVPINDKRKEVNMGRYKTEAEASEIYLKANMIMGNDKISTHLQERIKDENIALKDEDYNNKYLKKLIMIMNGEDVSKHKELNGRYNLNYDKNIELIHKLYCEGYNYYEIAKYLKENIPELRNAKNDTVKTKLEAHLKNKQNIENEIKKVS